MKRNLAIGMVTAAVLVVVVISLVLFKNSNNKRVIETGVSKVIEINIKDNIPEVELEDQILTEYFALLSASIVKGNSKDMVKESNSKAYQFFILKGEEAIDFLKAQIKSENITVRKKIAAEWLISEIIKAQRDEGEIRVEYWKAVSKNDCSGKIAPDEASNVWSSLPSNTVLQITGMLSMDWYTAKRISPLQIDQLSTDFLGTDEVECW